MMNDFPPTAQDMVVGEQLTRAIEEQLSLFNQLMEKDVDAFNQAFKALALDYLVN